MPQLTTVRSALFSAALGALFTASLVAAPAHAAAPEVVSGSYKIDPTHASLHWKVDHLGLSFYTARFTKIEAALTLDAADMSKSKLTVSVDPRSLETDYPLVETKDFDKKLIEDPKYFNAGEHPAITFASSKIEMTGDTNAKVTGDLTLLGVTKPVSLDVTMNGAMSSHPFFKKPATGFSATGTIKRSDFGMTEGIPFVGDEVKLIIEAEFLAE